MSLSPEEQKIVDEEYRRLIEEGKAPKDIVAKAYSRNKTGGLGIAIAILYFATLIFFIWGVITQSQNLIPMYLMGITIFFWIIRRVWIFKSKKEAYKIISNYTVKQLEKTWNLLWETQPLWACDRQTLKVVADTTNN